MILESWANVARRNASCGEARRLDVLVVRF